MTKFELSALVSAFSLLIGAADGMYRQMTESNSKLNRIQRSKFTEKEDQIICDLVARYGRSINWKKVAECLPTRTAKQCRERWFTHLAPPLTSNPWSIAEDKILMEQYSKHGSKWAKIVKHLPGRSEAAVKNRWHKLVREGKPYLDLLGVQKTLTNVAGKLNDIAGSLLRLSTAPENEVALKNENGQNDDNHINSLEDSGEINPPYQSDLEFYPWDDDLFPVKSDSNPHVEKINEQGTSEN